MYTSTATILAASAAVVSAASVPITPRNSASITPHDSFSSSVGVLGCKINTNRAAYWPLAVNCDQICVKVSYQGRSLNLLKVDSSASAFDISYDAWVQLGFGQSATEDPQTGGGIEMDYEFVDASECVDLMDNGKLPLSASNSMNYVASCISEPSSWVAQNYELYNIADSACHWGFNETCTLDLSQSNQPSCPHALGSQAQMEQSVFNIQYGTGEKVPA